MRNWHHKVIRLQNARNLVIEENRLGSRDLFIGVVEDLLEYKPLINLVSEDENLQLRVNEYSGAHNSLSNYDSQNKIVFRYKYDDEAGKNPNQFTQSMFFNRVKNGSFSNHTTSVAAIISGNSNVNGIDGICPNTRLLNAVGFNDIPIITLTHIYAKRNVDSYYATVKKYNKVFLKHIIPLQEENATDLYISSTASIINMSYSWPVGKRNAENGVFEKYEDVYVEDHDKNSGRKSVDYILRETFAYARNGKGSLLICSSGNGYQGAGFKITEDNRATALSNKCLIVSASMVNLDENNLHQYDLDSAIFSEKLTEYSNYGARIDICAPSSPGANPERDEIAVYSSSKIHCGDIGSNEDLITPTIISFDPGNLLRSGTINIENIGGVFPGQSIELGNKDSFYHELRFIKKTELLENNQLKITLDQRIRFTNSVKNGFTLVNTQAKILLFKKVVQSRVSSNRFKLFDMRGIKKILGDINQNVYVYPERNIALGFFTKIIYANDTNNIIEIQSPITFEIGTNERIIIVPDQILLEGKYKDNVTIELDGNTRSNGFFHGQMIKVNGEITDITDIDDNHIKTEHRLRAVGEKATIESLSYGNYTSRFSGTSAAAPIVTGVAALVLSANPQLNAAEIKHILKSTTEHIGNVTYRLQNDNTKYNYGYEVHEKFGAGRVNAEAAVQMALSWATTPKPRMLFWDNVDNTTSNNVPNSPDIWMSEINSPNTLVPDATNLYNSINTSRDQKIYVRVRNEGNRHSFQENDLRVLVAFTSETNPVFKFPDCWHQDTASSSMKTILLDVKEIAPIPANSNAVITIEWRNINDLWRAHNPEGNLYTYILAHISPFDGADAEVSLADIKQNKNLTCKEIFVQHNAISSVDLSGTKVPLNGDKSNLIATDVEKHEKFCVDIYNVQATELDTKQFKFSLLDKPNGAVESEVIIKKTNGNWDLSNLQDWLTADIVETDSALYTATHKNAEINYALSYDLTKAGKQIQFAVI